MPVLKIKLFGGIHVEVAGQPVTLAYDKVRALLAYLLIEARDYPQRRETLAGLLWPEQPEKEARHSLSQALLKLRQAVDSTNVLLDAKRHTVGWQTTEQIEWDTAAFGAHLRQCNSHPHRQPALCESCMRQRARAVALYKGPFLAGLSLPDAPRFEQWLTRQREYTHRQAMAALAALVTYHQQIGSFELAIEYAQQQLALEPWLEETHRRLMMLFARTGQRSLALKQYEQCRTVLQQELNAAVSPETATLRRQIERRPNFTLQNLPLAPTPFIGRQKETAALRQWLADATVRLITITGIGGMGKTRLALAAAQEFLDPHTAQPTAPFADGIYFIDLAPLTAPQQMETAVAKVFHLQLGAPSDGSSLQQLIDYLAAKHLLLIFDDFEHLRGGASLLTRLLQGAPHLTIVATSRTQLRLRGERIMSLSGLAYRRHGSDLESYSKEHDAAQMFLAAATQIVPELVLSQEDWDQIDAICRLVEGTPLALEIAARWMDTLPLAAITKALETDMARLEPEFPGFPSQDHSMRAVFQSSWQRLPESARRVLARASVFQGGFTLEAAITILGATHQVLSLLVSHSLLRFDRPAQRYHCHELLRQFSAAQLAAQPDLAQQTRQKHLAYYCQVARQGEQNLRGGDPIRWKQRLNQERGNWVAAFAWGYENDLVQTAQMAIHLSLFWFSSGQMQWGQSQYEKLLRRKDDLPQQVRGWVLTWYTAMIWVQGRLQESKELALEAYHLFQGLKDSPGIIMSYHHQYVVAFYQGHLEAAAFYNDQALALARGDASVPPWFLSVCLQTQSTRLMEAGREDAAYRAAAECYQLCLEHNNLFTGTYAMANLARLASGRGDFAEAKALCRQALAIAQDLDDPRVESIHYLVLGTIALSERDFPAAVEHLDTAVAISSNTNNTDILDEATMLLGRDAYTGTGAYELAFAALQAWAKSCLQLNNEANMAACLEEMAAVHWRLNPGSRWSPRWLAAAAAWRGVSDPTVKNLPAGELIQTIQRRLSESAFRQSWEVGAAQTVSAALAEAIAVR